METIQASVVEVGLRILPHVLGNSGNRSGKHLASFGGRATVLDKSGWVVVRTRGSQTLRGRTKHRIRCAGLGKRALILTVIQW